MPMRRDDVFPVAEEIGRAARGAGFSVGDSTMDPASSYKASTTAAGRSAYIPISMRDGNRWFAQEIRVSDHGVGARRLGDHIHITDRDDVSAIKDWLQRASAAFRAGSKVPPPFVSPSQIVNEDQTESEAFRRWFGDSKVRDASGKPLVVFHGTTQDVQGAFDLKKTGTRTGNKYGNGSVFFKSNPVAASAYAAEPGRDIHPIDQPNVIPAYLSLQDPLVIDAQAGLGPKDGYRSWTHFKERIVAAQQQGFDGVIVRGVLDHASAVTAVEVGAIDVYVAFRPEQIKSAIGNRGAFDVNDPRITMSSRNMPTPSKGPATIPIPNASSDAFRRWFSGSMVVDSNGEALLVYHGTPSRILREFDAPQRGIFFIAERELAGAFAEHKALGTQAEGAAWIVSAYLKLLNPFVANQDSLRAMAIELKKQDPDRFIANFEDGDFAERDQVVEVAKARGHDGMILERDLMPLGPDSDWLFQRTFVVFRPDQVRIVNNTPYGHFSQPQVAPAIAPDGPAECASGQPIRGQLGMFLSTGEVAGTASGRSTTPFPAVRTGTHRQAVSTIKRVDGWLIQNALAEAQARGDEFNASQFAAAISAPSQSDKDSAEQYLFGDSQPPVVPAAIRPFDSGRVNSSSHNALVNIPPEDSVTKPSHSPIIAFHGTSARSFQEFDTCREGAHFGSSEQAAARLQARRGMGRDKIIAVELNITNPLRLRDIGVWSNFNNLHRELSVHGHVTDQEADSIWTAWQQSDRAGWDALKSALAKHGHDGIVYENEVEGTGDSYIAFHADQIRRLGTGVPRPPAAKSKPRKPRS